MGFLANIFGNGKKEEGIQICAPAAGKLVPLSEVSDPTFSDGILGQGAAVIPSGNQFFSPVDGTVTTVFPTGHAAALTSADGAEVLLHIGLDTVKLNGKHFTIHAEEGQQVKKGDLLLEADLEQIKAEGFDIITPVVICNTDDFAEVAMAEARDVEVGDTIINLKK
ncbi:MAG: PTS glucose transporter subunit IIA [Lachnospiraceae bacterium]|nr:PTS glucose transporter subunit IIA [Lachnospiraceae bacterium]